ncbi:unnamed protein product [Fraxinus pennsylvanica]|uniref:Uncharacterized protein n=1 Tax=Fraxinus pennsylvanica TaxID=56036 RepID=A0AAD1YM34_9LAMI|nr:unnamed protein product [Fraxinus pennsylvanica]
MVNQSVPLMDPLTTLLGSVHEKLPEMGSMRSILFPNFGSIISTAEPHVKNEEWDEESLHREGDGYSLEGGEKQSVASELVVVSSCQLAWKWSEREGEDRKNEGGLKKISASGGGAWV